MCHVCPEQAYRIARENTAKAAHEHLLVVISAELVQHLMRNVMLSLELIKFAAVDILLQSARKIGDWVDVQDPTTGAWTIGRIVR
jgi:hypothetical protein